MVRRGDRRRGVPGHQTAVGSAANICSSHTAGRNLPFHNCVHDAHRNDFPLTAFAALPTKGERL